MDNLDYLLELGPRLRYRFLPEPDGQELDASLAVRGVISTDFANWRYQGITINPALSYRLRPFAEHDFRLVASLSPFWGVDGLNKYFYEVKPRDERAGPRGLPGRQRLYRHRAKPRRHLGRVGRLRLFGGVQLGYWKGSANGTARSSGRIHGGGGRRADG